MPIHAGDRLRLVDIEGMQPCELVAADQGGAIDPAILGVPGDGDARGLKRILSGNSESARSVRAGLERRGIDLSRARAVTLFGGESRPGIAAEFTVARDGVLVVAAPGGAMEAESGGNGAMRISYARLPVEDLDEGVRRLASAIRAL